MNLLNVGFQNVFHTGVNTSAGLYTLNVFDISGKLNSLMSNVNSFGSKEFYFRFL